MREFGNLKFKSDLQPFSRCQNFLARKFSEEKNSHASESISCRKKISSKESIHANCLKYEQKIYLTISSVICYVNIYSNFVSMRRRRKKWIQKIFQSFNFIVEMKRRQSVCRIKVNNRKLI